jgi:hypothetical protein
MQDKSAPVGSEFDLHAIVLSCFIRETGSAVLRRKAGDGPGFQIVRIVGAAR